MATSREFEGATLEEALGRASASLGVPEPKIQFQILDTGRRGLFGLGARSVRIRVDPGALGEPEPRREEAERPARPPHPARPRRGAVSGRAPSSRTAPAREADPAGPGQREIQSTVQRMMGLMALELTVRAHAADSGVRLVLEGEDRKLLLQKDGELLMALQFLLNRMARRAWPGAGRIQLTCDGHPAHGDDEVIELAREVSAQVAQTGVEKWLEPMNPYERRLVHLAVREFEGLTSHSEGDGFLKPIRISRK